MVKILIITLVLFSTVICFAGEKEELQLKQQLLQERLGRLTAEFEISKRELVEVQKALNELLKPKELPPEEKK